MDPSDAIVDNGLAAPDLPGRVRLEMCPKCGYSLTGLPASHRCPECGFAYDDRTFMLTGISRGASSMHPGRKWLWAIVAVGAWLGSLLLPVLFTANGAASIVLFLGALWFGLVIYLVATSRRERRGVEQFLFTAGGFGYCADLTPVGIADGHMIPWHAVDTVVIDRKGAVWHRIRIGSGRGSRGRLKDVRFDVGVRCDAQTAEWIRRVLAERIATARSVGGGPCLPGTSHDLVG